MTGIMLPRKPTEKEIRKDEREKVLDEIEPYAGKLYYLGTDPRLLDLAISLKDKLKALRQEGKVEK